MRLTFAVGAIASLGGFVWSSITFERIAAMRRKLRAQETHMPLLDRIDRIQLVLSGTTTIIFACIAVIFAVRFAWS